MKRRRFTYIPKDEIAEITTFNDVTFGNDDILDGAYIKGRKKFARGGFTADSLEKQALQAVGIDSWFNMEESDRQGLVEELASSGIIEVGISIMADGGKTNDDEYYIIIKNPKGLVTNKGYYGMGYNKKEIINLFEEKGLKYNEKGEKFGGQALEEYEFFLKKPTKYDIQLPKKMADGGMMAKGGMVSLSKYYKTLPSKQDLVGLRVYDENNDEFVYIKSVEDGIFAGKNANDEYGHYYDMSILSIKNDGRYMADGGVATAATYMVKYHMKDSPSDVKEKMFTDKGKAELFYETLEEEDDIVVMPIVELKSEAEAKPKNLFSSAKPVPATAAAKKKRERVQVDGIEDEIKRYDELKAIINNAEAEKEIIGGRLKEIGRDKFLDIYEDTGRRPANFDLADGNENILLEVTDKYLKVEAEKAAILEKYDGLLEVVTTYEFNKDILEKKVSNTADLTVGEVVSMLIQDSKLLSDTDKENLIKAKTTMRVPKGTLDRLMDYDNPREVFSLISPVLALK